MRDRVDIAKVILEAVAPLIEGEMVTKTQTADLNINPPELRSDEMYTPEYILQWARNAMGIDRFDCDPATTMSNRTNARIYYTEATNGLSNENVWKGNLFMNPPFSNQMPFVEKLLAELKTGNVNKAIVLNKADFRPKWAIKLMERADQLVLHKGSVKFVDQKSGARFGVVFYCFNTNLRHVRYACECKPEKFQPLTFV